MHRTGGSFTLRDGELVETSPPPSPEPSPPSGGEQSINTPEPAQAGSSVSDAVQQENDDVLS